MKIPIKSNARRIDPGLTAMSRDLSKTSASNSSREAINFFLPKSLILRHATPGRNDPVKIVGPPEKSHDVLTIISIVVNREVGLATLE